MTFARNMAYYRAARVNGEKDAPAGNFWVTVDGNFIDTCVLEWCKIFGDKNARHAWNKLVTNRDEFQEALYENIQKDSVAFAAEVEISQRYRDKFLAHLDSDRTMLVPHLDTMWRAVQFYFAHILRVEMDKDAADRVRRELGADLTTYYDQCFKEARAVYEAN